MLGVLLPLGLHALVCTGVGGVGGVGSQLMMPCRGNTS